VSFESALECVAGDERLRELYDAIEPDLHRYPAVDPRSFRARLEQFLAGRSSKRG
jgi:hypothetical protein